MAAVFRANPTNVGDPETTYDLEVNGRAGEYDLLPEEFRAALKRRRYPGRDFYVEEADGYRERHIR